MKLLLKCDTFPVVFGTWQIGNTIYHLQYPGAHVTVQQNIIWIFLISLNCRFGHKLQHMFCKIPSNYGKIILLLCHFEHCHFSKFFFCSTFYRTTYLYNGTSSWKLAHLHLNNLSPFMEILILNGSLALGKTHG